MKISVIVPTYNRPKALKLCLLSLASQSIMPFDILIADDGSTAETRDTVLEMQEKLKHALPIKHIWHEDIGFRKPKILNETVRQSTADYLIFIDGDCMAHRHFIRSHVDNSSPEAILSGKRVEILTKKRRCMGAANSLANSMNRLGLGSEVTLVLDVSAAGGWRGRKNGPASANGLPRPSDGTSVNAALCADSSGERGVRSARFALASPRRQAAWRKYFPHSSARQRFAGRGGAARPSSGRLRSPTSPASGRGVRCGRGNLISHVDL